MSLSLQFEVDAQCHVIMRVETLCTRCNDCKDLRNYIARRCDLISTKRLRCINIIVTFSQIVENELTLDVGYTRRSFILTCNWVQAFKARTSTPLSLDRSLLDHISVLWQTLA